MMIRRIAIRRNLIWLCSISLLATVLAGCAPIATPAAPEQPPGQLRTSVPAPAAPGAVESGRGRRYSTGGSTTVNDAAFDATFFKNYGVNPFIDTEDDHLSTFSMDVDTASYTVARSYILQGYLPDPDSVRVEEFVNYFRQGYAPPAEGEGAFAIHLAGAPSPFGTERHQLLRVGLQGQAIADEDRKDATLVFVIDVSGSMDYENRLGLVKRSLRLLVDELRHNDEVGIVVYGSRAWTMLDVTGAWNKERILEVIDSLQPGGSTNAEEGLLLGYKMAAQALRPERITRLILCSDGVANVGRTGPDSILEKVRGYVADGITLSTVGFGMENYNDILMEQLANDGDGNYAYVDALGEARRVFVENLTGMLQVIAQDAKVQVDFNPEVVRSYRLLGYENRRLDDDEFRDDEVDAGEVGAGHSVTALYELKFEQEAEGDQVATVYVRYADPASGEVAEVSRSIGKSDFVATIEEMSPHFQLDAAVAEYAEILRGSYWAQDGNLGDVQTLAAQALARLSDDDDVIEFVYLVTQAKEIASNE